MFLANKLNKGAGAPPATTDAQFNYVTMLLHGDGTNGAQNNTFLDSSASPLTITRNGNTTQGSFSPYGSNWSNYFDGSGSYLSLSSNTSLNFGTGDFTIECWLNIASLNGGVLIDFRPASTNGDYPLIYQAGSGLEFYASGGAQISSGTVTKGTWFHFALCRSGSSMKMFFNGTQTGSTYTASVNYSVGSTLGIGTSTFALGSSILDGYISNLRVLKGTALYTTTFTPSTTPLTAITNTSLLTCQSNRFIDNSSNVFPLTVGGTPSVQRFNPFGASTAYDTSVIGGSGYFDGTGDYLSVSTGTALNLITGDFTVEGWMYATDVIGYHTIFSNGDFPTTAQVILVVAAAPSLYLSNGSGFTIALSSSINVNINSWNHIAATASGTTYTIWVNGVSGGSTTNGFTRTAPFTTSVVGRLYPSTDDYYAKGYITNVRVVKGTALYTTTFTPPTAPLTAVTNTQLLLNTTNGAIFDNAMMNDLETVGNTQISTSVKKYGTGSLAFDGTGDYLSIASTPNLAFGTGNFTIELWAYRLSGTNNGLFQLSTTAGGFKQDDVNNLALAYASGGITYYANNNTYVPSTTVSNNQWDHLALVRSGTTTTLYFNGVSVSSITDSTNYTGTYLVVGGYYSTSYLWNGYIDDLRITKGYARYTANFTAPTAALPDIGPI